MDRGAWWAIVHRVTKSRTWLKWLSTHEQWKKNDNFYLLKNFLINCLSDPKPSKRLTYFFFWNIVWFKGFTWSSKYHYIRNHFSLLLKLPYSIFSSSFVFCNWYKVLCKFKVSNGDLTRIMKWLPQYV